MDSLKKTGLICTSSGARALGLKSFKALKAKPNLGKICCLFFWGGGGGGWGPENFSISNTSNNSRA